MLRGQGDCGAVRSRQPCRSLIRAPGQQRVQRRWLVRRDAAGQDFMGKLFGLWRARLTIASMTANPGDELCGRKQPDGKLHAKFPA